MGSVIKRGQRWYAVVDVVPPQNGKRRDQRKIALEASITTKKDATIALARIVTEMNGGQFVLPSKLTIAQLLRDHWLPHKALSASAKTIEGYREKVEGRLIPAFGSTLVSKLHQARIQQAYDEWIKSGLSAQTVKHHHSVLRNAMRYAVRMGLAANVVTDRVKLPTPQHVEMVALNEEQSLLLIEDVRDTWMRVPVAVALLTGLRRGELCALRWKDVDFRQSRIQVRQALEITRGAKTEGAKSSPVLNFKSPKTAKSRRAFKVGENVMQALRRHKSIQNEERLAFEGAYQDNDLVFCKADGSPVNQISSLTTSPRWSRSRIGSQG